MPAPLLPSVSALASLRIFDGLPTEQIERLRGSMTVTRFPAGANIITVDQPAEVTYVIIEGTVKVYTTQPDGSEVILAILGSGETIGEMSVVDRFARSATVITMEPSILVWLDRATFTSALNTVPQLAMNLAVILSHRLRLANAKIQALATLDVNGRLARHLIALADSYGQPTADGTLIPLRLTQSDLAALVGASRVRINQALASFRRLGLLTTLDSYRLVVHDIDALAEHCE